MALFFLLVGLELKREWLRGELAEASQVLLPAVAAVGGMLMPALIYGLFNYLTPQAQPGWAIPVATDIAFALGALSLLGKRISTSLKTFLMALAIFDDIGAILIIAIFYGQKISWFYLFCAGLTSIVLLLFNRLGIHRLKLYAIGGLALWWFTLKSGIHPTIAGVVLAFCIPEMGKNSSQDSWEEKLHPWVSFGIMPLFAIANAGFAFSSANIAFQNNANIALGIIAGLFIGKQLGVLSFVWLLVRLKLAKLPAQCGWLQMWGVSILCGIGFTMSLFLGTLAFNYYEPYMNEVRLGVFLGSLLSGIIGSLVLLVATRWKK